MRPSVLPAGWPRAIRPQPSGSRPVSPIARAADVTTLVGVAVSPLLGVRLGTLPIAELVILVALGLRGLELLLNGLPLEELRHHSLVLSVCAVVGIGGLLSGIVNGDALTFDLTRAAFTMVTSVLLVATCGTSARARRQLVVALAAGSTFLALSSYFLSMGGRAVGYSTHPNLLAHSCVIGLAATIYAADVATTPRSRRVWGLCALVQLGAIFQSGSRGSLVAAWVLIMLYLALGRSSRLVILAAIASYLAVLALASGVVKPPAESAVGRLLGDRSSQAANTERTQGLSDNLRVISEKPVFGQGFLPQEDPTQDYLNVHVVYLQAWIAAGAVAGLAMILLGLAMLLLPFGQPRAQLALGCGAAAIAVAWLFTNIFITRDQWLFLALAFRMAHSPLRAATRPSA